MSSRIYTHMRGLFFDYRRAFHYFKNEHFNNEHWYMEEIWSVSIRFEPHFWHIENIYYDGMTADSITLLGVTIGKSYGYDSRPLTDWSTEELNFAT
jgi:hypothetical protein